MKYPILFLALAFIACGKNESTPPATSAASVSDSMKQAINGWLNAANAGKYDEMSNYLAEDFIEHKSAVSRDGKLVKGWLTGLKEYFTNERKKDPNPGDGQIEAVCTEGNICVVRFRSIGDALTDSAGVQVMQRKHRVETIWLRWENGKFVESWENVEG